MEHISVGARTLSSAVDTGPAARRRALATGARRPSRGDHHDGHDDHHSRRAARVGQIIRHPDRDPRGPVGPRRLPERPGVRDRLERSRPTSSRARRAVAIEDDLVATGADESDPARRARWCRRRPWRRRCGEGGEKSTPPREAGTPRRCDLTRRKPPPPCFFPSVDSRARAGARSCCSVVIVRRRYAVAIAFCVAFYGRKNKPLVGLTERSRGSLRGGSHVPGQQVLPRRAVRTGHRARHRPPDRQGRVLDQPEHHRRDRQRRRQDAASRPGDWVYK